MEKTALSGIERELVLQYLIDGNVPVTLTPVSEKDEPDSIQPMSSCVVPIAIQPEKISVLKEGIILLEDVLPSVSELENKNVKVEFYFNRVGLFFVTQLKKVSSGFALVIPSVIERIPDIPVSKKYDFTARLVISVGAEGCSKFQCVPQEGFELFSRPVWASIELEKQERAKNLLEIYVKEARDKGKAGNGIQLINICRYMVEEKPYRVEAIEGRVKPFDILFVNHERIVLGFEKNQAFELSCDQEYPVEMTFALKETPAVVRQVFVTGKVCNLYSNEEKTKFVADMSYTTLKEEDLRFLYEKATSSLFI